MNDITPQQHTFVEAEEENEKELISVIESVSLFIKQWKWIALGVIIAMVIAFIYLRCTTPVYKIRTSIVLKEENGRGASDMPGTLSELAMMGAVSNVENETFILKSHALIHTVVNRLSLHTSYLIADSIREADLYTDSPVIVAMEQGDLDRLNEDILLQMQMRGDEQLIVTGTVAGATIDTLFRQLPALLMTVQGNITFSRRKGRASDERLINVLIQYPDAVTNSYRASLEVAPVSRTASVLNLSLETTSKKKGIDFLDMLVKAYNYDAIEDKNQEARSMQQFIKERIVIIDRELSTAEKNVEEYKREEGLTDLQTDLQRDMQMESTYDRQLVQVETQLNVIGMLQSYLSNQQNIDKTIPSNIGIEDPTLAAVTTEYNRLLHDRERLSQSMTDDNPAMIRLREQIAGLRRNITSSINSVQRALQIQQRDARNQTNLFGGRINNVPKQEREYMELSREQQIKADLFLMLLKKREENALALEAYVNKAKVLDKAALAGIVAPRSILVLLAALLLGLLVPAAFIYLFDLLRYRIRTRGDVDRITKVPVLGDIPACADGCNVVVKDGDTDEIDEAFRMLRTKMLLALGADYKVVIFTSTVPGEGKSFVALNTAISLSLLNKRVLLVGLDLRIPRLKEYMNLDTDDGISRFLSGYEKDIDKLIVPSGITGNLYVLPSGTIPPNPAELLSRPTLERAFSQLREKFDYILIDSAPVSPVADTLLLNRISDATLYVCRANFSSKGNLRFANDLKKQKQLKNMMLVVNDVDEFHHTYGYGYGYGYGNGKKKKKKKKG